MDFVIIGHRKRKAAEGAAALSKKRNSKVAAAEEMMFKTMAIKNLAESVELTEVQREKIHAKLDKLLDEL